MEISRTACTERHDLVEARKVSKPVRTSTQVGQIAYLQSVAKTSHDWEECDESEDTDAGRAWCACGGGVDRRHVGFGGGHARCVYALECERWEPGARVRPRLRRSPAQGWVGGDRRPWQRRESRLSGCPCAEPRRQPAVRGERREQYPFGARGGRPSRMAGAGRAH